MASETIKRLILNQMFTQGAKRRQERMDQERYDKISNMSGDLVGQQGTAAVPEVTSGYEQTESEMFPGEAPIQGLMNIDQAAVPAQAGTGLFNYSKPANERYAAYNKRLLGSGVPSLQKQGLSGMQSLQGSDAISSRGPSGRINTFTMGVPGFPNQIQTGYLETDEDGKTVVKTVGAPREARDPNIDLSDRLYNQSTGVERMKNLTAAELRKKEGVDIQDRLSNYSQNMQKAEAGLGQVDFMQKQLDDLANTATGWSTGFGTFLKGIPTSDANKWETMKTGVLSGLGLDKIAEMKAQSSTGATGMGALNEKELELLVSFRGKLEQANTPVEIKRVINNMKKLIDKSRTRMVRRMKDEYKFNQTNTEKYGSGAYTEYTPSETSARILGLSKPESQTQLPQGVTEADIAATMKLHNVTREQVLSKIK